MFELKIITKSKCTLESIESKNNLYEQIEGTSKLFRIPSENISLTDKFETFRFLPIERTNTLFIIAIPEDCKEDLFISFLGPFIQKIKSLLFITQPITGFLKALIHFDSQDSADNFYYHFNSKNFPQNKSEFCYCAFISNIDYTNDDTLLSPLPQDDPKTESDIITSKTQNTSINSLTSLENKNYEQVNEMSTCPLCIEKIETSSSGIETMLNLFPCERWSNYKKNCKVCSKFPMLSVLKCEKCSNNKSLWCCLVCGDLGCNRYQEQHAMSHFFGTKHRYSIELNTGRIWDYMTDTWIHRFIEMNESSSMILLEDNINKDDEQLSTQEFLKKLEKVKDEYKKVVSAQLEIQRKFYETEIEKIINKYKGNIKDKVSKVNEIKEEINEKSNKMKQNEKLTKEYIKKIAQYEKKVEETKKTIEFNRECIKGIKMDIEKEKQGEDVKKVNVKKEKILIEKRLKKKELQKELEELYKKLSK